MIFPDRKETVFNALNNWEFLSGIYFCSCNIQIHLPSLGLALTIQFPLRVVMDRGRHRSRLQGRQTDGHTSEECSSRVTVYLSIYLSINPSSIHQSINPSSIYLKRLERCDESESSGLISPCLSDDRSCLVRSGWVIISMYMVGVPYITLHLRPESHSHGRGGGGWRRRSSGLHEEGELDERCYLSLSTAARLAVPL